MHKAVLNTRCSSVVQIVEYSVCPKTFELQEDNKASSVHVFEEKIAQSPPRRSATATSPQNNNSDSPREPDTESEPESESVRSDSESVIIRINHQTSHSPIPIPTDTDACAGEAEEAERESRSRFQTPRKRSAREASLPDSVTDTERETRPKLKKAGPGSGPRAASRSRSPVRSRAASRSRSRRAASRSAIKRRVASRSPVKKIPAKPSLIPRPVSLLNHKEASPERVPLPRDSAPVTQADFRRFEMGYSIQKEVEAVPVAAADFRFEPDVPTQVEAEWVCDGRLDSCDSAVAKNDFLFQPNDFPVPEEVEAERDAPVTEAAFQFEPNDPPVPKEAEAESNAPVMGDDFGRFEKSPISAEVERVGDERKYEACPAMTPLCKRNLDQVQELEKLSTVASLGSPCEAGDLLPSFESDRSDQNAEESDGVSLTEPVKPQLVLRDGIFYVQTPPNMESAAYDVFITLSMRLQKGRPTGWRELVVHGLPRLRPNDYGYLYFHIPAGQGIEFRTTPFKRCELLDGCLLGQFMVLSTLVVLLRTFDARFYGLKDIKVSVMPITRYFFNNGACLIERRDLCSVQLIDRVFWAEKCGFTLYLMGGPNDEREFSLDKSRHGFQTIDFDSVYEPACHNGVTRINVTCCPSVLGLFSLNFQLKVPTGVSSWAPFITATLDGIKGHMPEEFRMLEQNRSGIEELDTKLPDYKAAPVGTQRQTLTCRNFRKLCLVLLGVMLLSTVSFCFGSYYARMEATSTNNSTQVFEVEQVHDVESVYRGDELRKTVHELNATASQPELLGLNATISQLEPGETRKPVVEDSQPPTELLSLRDRIDYLLGWRGPVVHA